LSGITNLSVLTLAIPDLIEPNHNYIEKKLETEKIHLFYLKRKRLKIVLYVVSMSVYGTDPIVKDYKKNLPKVFEVKNSSV
jgi:hypothetical protein